MAAVERFFKLIVIGRMRDRMLASGCEVFLQRLNNYGRCEEIVLPDSDVTGEGRSICRELDKNRGLPLFVMSEEGREYTTVEFADKLSALQSRALFVIGGPFGLAPEVKQRATQLLSLSKMTFTHELARLILCEQLYRAMNYLNGGNYHHR